MSRRLALWALPLLVMLGFGTTPARAITIASTSFDFTGACTDCTGLGKAELTLSGFYQLGTAITLSNFLQFHYDGTDLLPAFTIRAADATVVNGSIVGPLPAAENFSVFTQSGLGFRSGSDGSWCVGPACFADYGSTSSWFVPGATIPTAGVPEPWPLALLAGGLVAGFTSRRRRR